MIDYRMMLLAGLLAACTGSAPADPGQTADVPAEDAQIGRYIVTVKYGQDGKLAPDQVGEVVAALEANDAASVEVLEGLPTLIVVASPDAIAAAEETGLVASVQQDSLSAPQ